jgi:hemerythrin
MATFNWDKSLEVGNELIDSEHKELIRAINEFFDAVATKGGQDKLQATLRFLNDYTIKHFSDEEGLQRQYKYPNYPAHHEFHEGYKKIVRDTMHEFISKGASDELIAKAKHDVGEVIINHIKTEDIKLAAFIRVQH